MNLSTDTEARLAALAALPEGWDSYGAPPIAGPALDAARAALGGMFISPTCNGGVAIEIAGVEIKFDTDGQTVIGQDDRPEPVAIEPTGGWTVRRWLRVFVPTRRKSLTSSPLNTPALLLPPEQLAERDAAFEQMRRRRNTAWAAAADVVVN